MRPVADSPAFASASSAALSQTRSFARSEGVRLTGRDVLKLLRAHHWTKNLFCFAGAAFGQSRILDLHAWLTDCLVFLIFCCISSAVYLLNDVMDRERDREHPRKCKRPIAAGLVAPRTAIVIAAALGIGALVGAWELGVSVFVCAGLYVLNNVAYSTGMKHFALFDVLAISIGFILRLLAGIYPVGDLPTAWIVLCVFFLSLFLGFSKRRAELGSRPADEPGGLTRPVLVHYTREFLDQLIASSAVMSILCYALFTVVGEKNPSLIVTIPIVFYAIMHYARMVMNLRGGEEPERILIMDRNLQASILWWLAIYTFIVHGRIHIFR